MLNGKRVAGLLLMGGSGLRFGSEVPKQFHRLAGKKVYLHTLDVFLKTKIFDEITLSCHPQWIEAVQKEIPSSLCPIRVISGGSSRQASSLLGLESFRREPNIVIIHDAVRPFVSQEILIKNAQMALIHGAVDTCIPSADTLVHTTDEQTIASIPSRKEFLRGQTPQSFSYPLIVQAHHNTKQNNATDDCSLVIEKGQKVHIVLGSETNLKITSELDLALAEHLFRLRCSKLSSFRKLSLEGKLYAVIGGTGGIGGAIVNQLQKVGARALIFSKKTNPSIDLTNPKSIEALFAWIEETYGALDGLINCAGWLLAKPLDISSFGEIERSLAINLQGLILSCKSALLKKGAHVINMASSSYTKGRKGFCVYSAAKAGVVNFTQGWAEERPDLTVHAIIPQRTNTRMRREHFPLEDPTTLLTPESIAQTVLSLLTAKGPSGQLIEITLSADQSARQNIPAKEPAPVKGEESFCKK